MKFEYGIIPVLGILVIAIFALAASNPDEVPYWKLLDDITIEREIFSDDPDIFEKTLQKEDSTCYTSLNGNLFCYEKPRMYEKLGVSYVRGENGIQGELHFDPVEKGEYYFTIKNMTQIDGNTAMITLADKDYSIQGIDGVIYFIPEKFEYSAVLEKFDSFIAKCNNYEGTIVTLVQYLGISRIDGVDYFMTWHTPAHFEKGIRCNYPEIMQYSLEYNFGDL